MTYKEIFKSIFGATLIVWEIGFGITVINYSKFWGYFNFLIGGLMVYFLCLNYFETKKDKTSSL